jgi:hypothetical protein
MAEENDFVADAELLYRRIPSRQRVVVPLYEYRDDGTIRIYSTAFSNRDFRISVDRAKLRNYDPREVQEDENDGVVSLLARDVRSIVGLVRKTPGGNECQFKIDVEPAPLPDNNAHAEISAIPGFDQDCKKFFRRLCEHLVQIAEKRWEILPDKRGNRE